MVPDLPRDVELRIVRLLDVDARRALGLYARLRVPGRLAADISRTLVLPLPKPQLPDWTCDTARIANIFSPRKFGPHALDMIRQDISMRRRTPIDARLLRTLRAAELFFARHPPDQAVAFVAGVPDGPEDANVVAYVGEWREASSLALVLPIVVHWSL